MVDFAGSGGSHALGAFFAVAAVTALGPRPPRSDLPLGLPQAHFPLMAIGGAFLALPGWFGVTLGNPMVEVVVSRPHVLLNLLLAASAGALASSLCVWLVRGRPDLMLMIRGAVAALVTISASCPFASVWTALGLGALSGLCLPLASTWWRQGWVWETRRHR